ncbi:hypothetical protein M231_04647 [Tremella mesenterica]|uniref:Uncharacterized protein n=1 Tax=Tremella mesenterica TaxID=5217 RepID=A0A4Q1BK17_TREME|nr:hypothetical protein M231_04647 [Tremella mesenterica]
MQALANPLDDPWPDPACHEFLRNTTSPTDPALYGYICAPTSPNNAHILQRFLLTHAILDQLLSPMGSPLYLTHVVRAARREAHEGSGSCILMARPLHVSVPTAQPAFCELFGTEGE